MPGFLGVIGTMAPLGFAPETRHHLLQEEKTGKHWSVARRTLQKFLKDKPFFEDNNFLVLSEGVVLNRISLEAKYKSDNFAQAMITSYQQNGEAFFNEFRGSFSGLFCDKAKDIWIIYTNHIGDKQVFYAKQRDAVVFGSEPGFVIEYFKRNHFPLSLNEQAAYMLLTYGFFIENHTLVNEMKKLTAGHYLRITNSKIQEIQYHRFTNEPDDSKSEEEWIDGIDHYFRQAVKRQFDKDLEYGYKHITTLSGGLDSRMTVWVAHHMGYTQQLNTTFSQSNYLDETIAKKIATDLGHDWLFKALDHGNFLKDIDVVTAITCGGGSYAGLVHGKSMYDMLNFDSYGIAHTGQIGDAILGTFYKQPVGGTPHKNGEGAYSTTIIDRLNDYHFFYEYANSEIFALYARAFNGANQGLLVFQEHTESASPFMDVEFLSFCYSIPVEMRFKHKIYFNWILTKYPGAGKYVWEKTKKRIEAHSDVQFVSIFGRKVDKKKVPHWMAGAIKRRVIPERFINKKQNIINAWHMNPMEYWLENNSELTRRLEIYYSSGVKQLENKTMMNDCEYLFKHGTAGEKFQVLSFLSALKATMVELSNNPK